MTLAAALKIAGQETYAPHARTEVAAAVAVLVKELRGVQDLFEDAWGHIGQRDQTIETLTAEIERRKAENEWYVETQREQTQRAIAAEAELIRLKAGLIGRLAEGEGT